MLSVTASAAGSCGKLGRCVFDDDQVNLVAAKAKEADGFIFGVRFTMQLRADVYCPSWTACFIRQAVLLLTSRGRQCFRQDAAELRHPLNVLNKYFGISNMITVGSQYWNMVHGNKPEEVLQDLEGLQIMRTLGRNMAWMIKCIEAGKAVALPHRPEEKSGQNQFYPIGCRYR